MIVAAAVAAALAAGAIALAQPKSYTARATLQALDPAQTAGYAELSQYDVNASAETAAQLAQTATQTPILDAVKAQLRLADSLSQIRARLTLSEDQQSDYVLLDATAPTATGAAGLANAAAAQVVRLSNREARAHFAAVAAQEKASALALLLPYAGKNPAALAPAQQARFKSDSARATQLEEIAGTLEGFSKLLTVAEIAEPAPVPGSPSSPHPVTSLLVGLLVGLGAGLALAWFFDSLDQRVRRPGEAEALLGLQILGEIPSALLGKRAADPWGATPFRMLRTNVRLMAGRVDDPPRKLLVTSAVRGDGRTSVAVGFAMSAATSGLKTLLIEADFRRPAVARWLGLEPSPGLVDFVTGRASAGEIVQVRSLRDHSASAGPSEAGRLDCVTAGNVAGLTWSEVTAGRFEQMLSELSETYDAVVIDASPLLEAADAIEMLPLVDAALLCVRVEHTAAEQIRRAREVLRRSPVPAAGAVLTGLRSVEEYYGPVDGSGTPSADKNREVSASASGVPTS
jgi:succinoglycan biosynthesis transport protein ExoP